MANSAFWRDLARRFREEIPDPRGLMRAEFSAEGWGEGHGNWFISGVHSAPIPSLTDSDIEMFKHLAAIGAAALGFSGAAEAWTHWLDRLRDEGVDCRKSGRGIDRLCEASARYCLNMEAQSYSEGAERLAAPTPESETHGKQEERPVFCNTGDIWTVSYAGKTSHLHDTRGLHFISRLLREPGKKILARDLAAISDSRSQGPMGNELAASEAVSEGELSETPDMGDTGEVLEVLDRPAINAYRARLHQLSADRITAEKEPNPAWLARIEEETELIEQQLRAGTGLGGRARKFTSTEEKARSNVRMQIKAAIEKISEENPELRSYLSRTIKTGMRCSYQPDPTTDIDWIL